MIAFALISTPITYPGVATSVSIDSNPNVIWTLFPEFGFKSFAQLPARTLTFEIWYTDEFPLFFIVFVTSNSIIPLLFLYPSGALLSYILYLSTFVISSIVTLLDLLFSNTTGVADFLSAIVVVVDKSVEVLELFLNCSILNSAPANTSL